MPELSLSLDLHLHHRVVSILDVLQGFLNPWKQVNDLLFADQDLTVGASQDRADVHTHRVLEQRQKPTGLKFPVDDFYLR